MEQSRARSVNGNGGRWRVGVDSGGTFTDICLFDEESGAIRVWKVPSTPDDPSRAIAQAVEDGIALAGGRERAAVVYFGHGTTVATNALIQHRGVRTGLITTKGFRDLLEIARQRRPSLYDLQAAAAGRSRAGRGSPWS
jgi:N-methylhydantoinase A